MNNHSIVIAEIFYCRPCCQWHFLGDVCSNPAKVPYAKCGGKEQAHSSTYYSFTYYKWRLQRLLAGAPLFYCRRCNHWHDDHRLDCFAQKIEEKEDVTIVTAVTVAFAVMDIKLHVINTNDPLTAPVGPAENIAAAMDSSTVAEEWQQSLQQHWIIIGIEPANETAFEYSPPAATEHKIFFCPICQCDKPTYCTSTNPCGPFHGECHDNAHEWVEYRILPLKLTKPTPPVLLQWESHDGVLSLTMSFLDCMTLVMIKAVSPRWK
jgi:hypothetical protein